MLRTIAALLWLPLVLTACDTDTQDGPDDASVDGGGRGKADAVAPNCDDDSVAVCLIAEPDCPDGSVVAVHNGCFTCAETTTCEPLGLPANCDDGVALCAATEPFCGPLATAAQIGGCWQCVDAFSCEPIEVPEEPEGSCEGSCGGASEDGCWCDESCAAFGDCCPDIADACDSEELGPCDDGSAPVCLIPEPECADDEILAVQNGCIACVDPQTCQ